MIKHNLNNELKEIEEELEQLSNTNFDDDDYNLSVADVKKSLYYQAYWQIFNRINLFIRELRQTDKTTFPDEVAKAIYLWASHSGCWIDVVIERELLDSLIRDEFLLQDEIEIFNQSNCYRQE